MCIGSKSTALPHNPTTFPSPAMEIVSPLPAPLSPIHSNTYRTHPYAHSHPHSHPHTPSHTPTRPHTPSDTLTHPHTPSDTPSHILTHPHTHPHTRPHTPSHVLTHPHTHPHSSSKRTELAVRCRADDEGRGGGCDSPSSSPCPLLMDDLLRCSFSSPPASPSSLAFAAGPPALPPARECTEEPLLCSEGVREAPALPAPAPAPAASACARARTWARAASYASCASRASRSSSASLQKRGWGVSRKTTQVAGGRGFRV